MDISTYITALLEENETVIVPGFGAFVSVYKPAVIKENEIIPPGKEIRFLQQVKNNDGLLAMHIARSKKVSYDDSLKKIERAFSKIIYQLDKGEKVTFGELGEFSYNENREITFQPFNTCETILSGGFEPVSIDDLPETTDETAFEPANGQETTVEEIVTAQESSYNNDEVAPIQMETHEGKDNTNRVEIETQDTSDFGTIRKRPVWIWYILAAGVILAVVLILFLNRNKESNADDIKIEVILPEKNIQDAPAETVAKPAETVAKTVNEPVEEIIQPMFYLVGGGFANEENANKFIKQLAETGVTGTLLGKHGNLYLVGIESFKTAQEAYKELNRRMRENPDCKLWVYQKK